MKFVGIPVIAVAKSVNDRFAEGFGSISGTSTRATEAGLRVKLAVYAQEQARTKDCTLCNVL